MSDLIKRLRTTARNQCEAHNNIDQYDPAWERKPKDFCAWEAADEIERLTESNTILEYRLADSHLNVDRLTSRLRDRKNALDHAIDYGHRMDDRIKVLESQLESGIDGQSMLPTELLDGMHDRIKVLEDILNAPTLADKLKQLGYKPHGKDIYIPAIAAADKEVSDE